MFDCLVAGSGRILGGSAARRAADRCPVPGPAQACSGTADWPQRKNHRSCGNASRRRASKRYLYAQRQAGRLGYLQTSFPITEGNRIVIPVGSYLRGELLESKRPGRVKGRGEFRLRLDTLILPNGYTVSLNAAPRSADSGGKETMDAEGKVKGPGGKGNDAGTVAQTTAAGAG